MATLTETAYYSRIMIKWGGIILLLLMVGRVLGNGMIEYWKKTHPPKLPPPTQGFGPLPPIAFPEAPTTTYSYTLELPTGEFVFDESDRIPVYKIPELLTNLIAPERAKEDAKRLGFTGEPVILSDRLYQWSRPSPLPSTLDLKIYSGTFNYRVNWLSSLDFLTEKRFGSDDDAIDKVKDYLQRADLLHSDLETGDTRITYLKTIANDYRETVSLSEADFIQVDIYRAKVDDKYPVMTPDPDKGLVRAIVSGNKNVDLVAVDYTYYPVEYETMETYWLKTPEEAYQELQQGNGFVARVKPEVTQITVRRAELGYYDSFERQEYLQPIYIFRGDDNFIGYVPALAPAAPVAR